METLRQSCIELVDSIDKAVRTAEQADPAKATVFDKAVAQTMRELADVPAIHKLRGRVREAGQMEIMAAMSVMANMATEKKGIHLVDALIESAIKSDKPEVAAKLRHIQGSMLRRSQPSKN